MKRCLMLCVAFLACWVSSAAASTADIWNAATAHLSSASQITVDVRLDDGERIRVQQNTASGQVIRRYLNGQLLRTSVALWDLPSKPGNAQPLTGYWELRSNATCWTRFQFSSAYRPFSDAFYRLQNAFERNMGWPPALSSKEIKVKLKGASRLLAVQRKLNQSTVKASVVVDRARGFMRRYEEPGEIVTFTYPKAKPVLAPAAQCAT